MPYLSTETMDIIADRVVAAYLKLPLLQGTTPMCIEPEYLIRHVLKVDLCQDYHLSTTRNLFTGQDPLGFIAFKSQVPGVFGDDLQFQWVELETTTVMIEKDLANNLAQRGRYHYTLMHEAAHLILVMLSPKDYLGTENWPQFLYRKADAPMEDPRWDEWRADQLASRILMPRELILNNMKRLGLPEQMQPLNRLAHREEYRLFEELAALMCVSKQALAIRLKKLGILPQDPIRSQKYNIDIVCDDEDDQKKEVAPVRFKSSSYIPDPDALAEQERLKLHYSGVMRVARKCPYCEHVVCFAFRGHHAAEQIKCPKCGREGILPPLEFRLAGTWCA